MDRIEDCMQNNLQVPWEIDIKSILNGEVVAQELKWNDVEETLQAIHRLRYADGFAPLGNTIITLVANNDRLRLPCGNLSECRLHLGVQGILGHNDDDGHILVDQGERTVFEFASQDTLRVHVRDFLDLQSTFQASSVLVSSTHDQQTTLVGENASCKQIGRAHV